ncbi:MAG TPA: 6-phosphogluconolactonase [Gemmatimonadales bacterium]|nr:6-phosphogluconolactonase [Gemmatimonadales bacterium]
MFPSAPAVMAAAAERFVEVTAQAVRAHGRCAVALSGGSTPEGLYRLLATAPYRRRVSWKSVEVFWGDERCVPPDDAASNYRMARAALLDHVPIPPAGVHRIRGEADPEVAAREYEATLRACFAAPHGPPGPGGGFDLMLLGLGRDGHTASIFPGSAALAESERWTLAQRGPEPPHWRVTVTPALIRASREVLFLVTGADKAAALHRVLEDRDAGVTLPAGAVLPTAGMVRWMVDAAAAGKSA